jgi:natural product biosynthesis luciferase-like monooxygenase protein/amino acid adenylation domain-containing protein/non-ribosomal peptide synthase protein (TIGR01720 family)
LNSTKKDTIVEILPLTDTQIGILCQSIGEDDPELYCQQIAFTVDESMDRSMVSTAWEAVVNHHDALRTVFVWEKRPLQVILRAGNHQIVHYHATSQQDFNRQYETLLELEKRTGFNLKKLPLFRVVCIHGAQTTRFIWTYHHILMDGWSVSLLLERFLDVFGQLAAGKSPYLQKSMALRDYMKASQTELPAKAIDFWRNYLQDSSPCKIAGARLYEPSASDSYSKAMIHNIWLNEQESMTMEMRAREIGISLNMLYQLAWGLTLRRITGRDDVIFGMIASCRNVPGSEDLVGLTINTLPVRIQFDSTMTISALAESIRTAQAQMMHHEQFPLKEIINLTSEGRSGQELFDSLMVMENFDDKAIENADLICRNLRLKDFYFFEKTHYPVSVMVKPGKGKTRVALVCRPEVIDDFKSREIENTLKQCLKICMSIPEGSPIGPSNLALSKSLAPALNLTEQKTDVWECVRSIIIESPDAPALVFHDKRYTYSQLGEETEKILHSLKQQGFLISGNAVGICMERSEKLLFAILAVIKGGGTFVPLDPKGPSDRLVKIVESVDVELVITDHSTKFWFNDVTGNFNGESLELVSNRRQAFRDGQFHGISYVMHTSGSTGTPKGVAVTRKNLSNFFQGMDQNFGNTKPGKWLAVTNSTFDISILELIWPLTKAFEVVLADLFPNTPAASEASKSNATASLSLFNFPAESNSDIDKYKLFHESAVFADKNNWQAVWIPERHFHSFGSLFPNPSVGASYIAALTTNVRIRAGSVVAPLHDPIRIAEEWSMVDNLSNGRVEVAFASGWHPNDFVFFPENFSNRYDSLNQAIETVDQLWSGGTIERVDGSGNLTTLAIQPKPVQNSLPKWLTASGSPATFKAAGERGFRVLTHLLGQNLEELKEKIKIYREAWAASRHAGSPHVALMLHTYVGSDPGDIEVNAKPSFKKYLRTSLHLLNHLDQDQKNGLDWKKLDANEQDDILEHAFQRYAGSSSLIVTAESLPERMAKIKEAGIDEFACLVDFGIARELVMESLVRLQKSVEKTEANGIPDSKRPSSHIDEILQEISKENPTHLQCTPSTYNYLRYMDGFDAVHKTLRFILLGGEAVPQNIVAHAARNGSEVWNMYGPTETTIWSASGPVKVEAKNPKAGLPIINTSIYVLDHKMDLLEAGAEGEIYIGGSGVSAGYLSQPANTAVHFLPDPYSGYSGSRMYRTGDRGCIHKDGQLEIFGRIDQQIKIRGHRVELGEIESALSNLPEIMEAAVIAVKSEINTVLHAFFASSAECNIESIESRLKLILPHYMIPHRFTRLTHLPKTPNGKIDRKQLTNQENLPEIAAKTTISTVKKRKDVDCGAASTSLIKIWEDTFKKEPIGLDDNFFDLGGDSILAIQICSKSKAAGFKLSPRIIFQYGTIAAICQHIEVISSQANAGIDKPALTPAQTWFFSWDLKDINHFNQAILLRIKESFPERAWEDAVRATVKAHPTLKSCFMNSGSEKSEWISSGQESRFANHYIKADFSDILQRDWRDFIESHHESLDLEKGIVFKFLHLKFPDREFAFMIGHHLVVDGISWRVLVDDISKSLKGETLEPEEISTNAWANAVKQAAQSVMSESPPWLSSRNFPVLNGNQILEVDNRQEIRLLDGQTFHDLIKARNLPLGMEPDEVMIIALDQALQLSFACETWTIDTERHGRDLIKDLDVARNVGWFTNVVPLRLNTARPDTNWLQNLPESRDALRTQMKENAWYFAKDPHCLATIPRDVMFNYLGQDYGLQSETFRYEPEFTGTVRGRKNTRHHLLELNCFANSTGLSMEWTYTPAVVPPEKMRELSEIYLACLTALVTYLSEWKRQSNYEHDFPLAELDQTEFKEIKDKIAKYSENASGPRGDSKAPQISNIFRMTHVQTGLMFEYLRQMDKAYYQQFRFEVTVENGLDSLLTAVNGLWRSQSELRSFVVFDNLKHPVIVTLDESAQIPLTIIDIAGIPNPDDRITELLNEEIRRGFALGHDLPFRIHIFQKAWQDFEVVWSYPHLLLDGWSLANLLDKLMTGRAATGVPSFCEYVSWLRRQDSNLAAKYWKTKLHDINPFLLQDSLKSKVSGTKPEYGTLEETVNRTELENLKKSAAHHRATLNALTQAAWVFTLSQYSGLKDIVTGITLDCRPEELANYEKMVGLFINTLPFRLNIGAISSFNDLITLVQNSNTELYEYRHADLSAILENMASDSGRELFNTHYVFENFPVNQLMEQENRDGPLVLKNIHFDEFTGYDLSMAIVPTNNSQLSFSLTYNVNVFTERFIMGFFRDYIRTIKAFSNPKINLREFSQEMREDWRQQVQHRLTAAHKMPIQDRLNLNSIKHVALERPSKIAYVFQGTLYSFQEFEVLVRRTMIGLSQHGLMAGSRIICKMPKSIEMVALVHAAMRMGSTYVPLDIDWPEKRVLQVLSDFAKAFIISPNPPQSHAGITWISPESLFADLLRIPDEVDDSILAKIDCSETLSAKNEAYIIYTSGTTGKPKGTVNTRTGLSHQLGWGQTYLQIAETDVIAQTSEFAFDASLHQLFSGYIMGVPTVIFQKEELLDPDRFIELVSSHRVTILDQTPSVLSALLNTDSPWPLCTSVRIVQCGGESVSPDVCRLLREKFPNLQIIINVYGPSETSITALCHPLGHESNIDIIPIGSPSEATRIEIVDESLNPVPPGIPGELLIAGEIVGLGYLNQGDKTASSFIPDLWPRKPGDRLYRTGDLVVQGGDRIYFLGRKDEQVKLRGIRIELEGIRSALLQTGICLNAYVELEQKAENPKLAATVKLVPGIDLDSLRNALRDNLPPALVPEKFYLIDHWPMGVSGKLDRNRLTLLRMDPISTYDQNHSEALSNLEMKIMKCWESVFERSGISKDDNFFSVGGNSLKILQLLSLLRKNIQEDVKIQDIFTYSTVRTLAASLEKGEGKDSLLTDARGTGRRRVSSQREQRSRARSSGSKSE